jgi:hypothetical protein
MSLETNHIVQQSIKHSFAIGQKVRNIPVSLAKGMQAKLIGDFSSVHGIRKILFVCEHQKHSITQLIL